MMNAQAKPIDSMRDPAIADWVVLTCIRFGTTVATAYQVAGLFLKAIEALPREPTK